MSTLFQIICLCGVLAACSAIWTAVRRIRFRLAAEARRGESYATLREDFHRSGIPEDVLEAVYRFFQSIAKGPREPFPVRSEDLVVGLYCLDEDELEDAVCELIEKSGRKLPDEILDLRKLRTVADLAALLARCPVDGLSRRLLRPADAPASETLLRPAGQAADDPGVLLRADV